MNNLDGLDFGADVFGDILFAVRSSWVTYSSCSTICSSHGLACTYVTRPGTTATLTCTDSTTLVDKYCWCI